MATFFNKIGTGHRRKIISSLCLLIPGIAADFVIHSGIIKKEYLEGLLSKLDQVYLTVIGIVICNSLLMIFLDIYSRSEKSRYHPLKGFIQALQVIMFFIGGIIVTAILIDKSPTALLTGLGASAAVLMLVFKDSILGFVAGVQLSRNNMIRIGDWIQMPDGSANGTVEEISLNTVKVRNWDNTISTIPPYTLISTTFRNWRGMQESPGRRVDKMIHIDIKSLKVLSEEQVRDICGRTPLLGDFHIGDIRPTNSQLYRVYIGKYLAAHPLVAKDLDLITAQREASQFGLPIEVYFFITDKTWNEYESIQSDIFDHLLAMAAEFDLKLYQLPG